MQSVLGKTLLAFLLTATFLIPRVADLHAFEHLHEAHQSHDENEGHQEGDSDEKRCELCHVMTAEDPKDLYFINDISYQEVFQPAPDTFEPATTYVAPLVIIASPTSVYNKPPPVL